MYGPSYRGLPTSTIRDELGCLAISRGYKTLLLSRITSFEVPTLSSFGIIAVLFNVMTSNATLSLGLSPDLRCSIQRTTMCMRRKRVFKVPIRWWS